MTDSPTPYEERLRSSFERDGFVAWPGFLSGEELTELQQRLEAFHRDRIPGMRREHVFYEDKSRPETLKQLQLLCDYDPWFGERMHTGRFRRLAELLLSSDVVPKNLQWFNKPPGIGKETPPHQDGFYFKLQSCAALTMWLALDDVDQENGCVRYVTGSHRDGMRRHGRSGCLGFSQSMVDFGRDGDTTREVMMPARPGDLLVHHALTIHRADGNSSADRHRRALGLIYYSAEAQEDTQAHDRYQQRLAEDLKSKGQI